MYNQVFATPPQVTSHELAGRTYYELETQYIYRGVFDDCGEPSTLKKAREEFRAGYAKVYAIDLNMAPCLGRVFIHGVYSSGDAYEALYEAARDMGTPEDQNRINLFTELYGECDTNGPCWCKGEHGNITVNGVEYHENEAVVIAVGRVKNIEHIHDGGWHKYHEMKNRRARETWHELRSQWLRDGIPLKGLSPWKRWRF